MKLTLAFSLYVLLAALGAPALAQLPSATGLWRPLTAEGEPDTSLFINGISGNSNGGWVAVVGPNNSPPGTSLVGVIPGLGQNEPGVLREPETLHGFTQTSMDKARLRGNSIAYLAAVESGVSAWVDSRPIAVPGTPVGATSSIWTEIERIEFGPGGAPLVLGIVDGPDGDAVLWNSITDEFLLRGGEPLNGLDFDLAEIWSVETSPRGQHWAAVVAFVDPNAEYRISSAIVVDGEIFTDPQGRPIRSERAPSFMTRVGGFGRPLGHIQQVRLTDEGECVFECLMFDGLDRFAVRNGRVVQEIASTAFCSGILGAADSNGFALSAFPDQRRPLDFEGQPLIKPFLPGIDIDGDGAVDAEWRYRTITAGGTLRGNSALTFVEEDRALVAASVQRSDGLFMQAVLRLDLAQPSDIICSGAPNSSGGATHLRATGFDDAAYNDLTLQVADLPPGMVFLPLVSLEPSMPTQIPGSVGQLCLGGAIGRMGSTAIPTDGFGPVSVRIFTNVLPQPNGPVAALPGDTWYVQLWYRDGAQQPVTNFSDAIAIHFR